MSDRTKRLMELAKAVFNNDSDKGDTKVMDDDLNKTLSNYIPEHLVSVQAVDSHLENELHSNELGASKDILDIDQYTSRSSEFEKDSTDNLFKSNFAKEILHNNEDVKNIESSSQSDIFITQDNDPIIGHLVSEGNRNILLSVNVSEVISDQGDTYSYEMEDSFVVDKDTSKNIEYNNRLTISDECENDISEEFMLSKDLQETETNYQNEVLLSIEEMTGYQEKENFSVYSYASGVTKVHESPEVDKCENQVQDLKKDIYKSPFLTKNKYKTTICKFCDSDIISKHFARHLQRQHSNEREVKEILSFQKRSFERRNLLALLRNDGNLEPALRGQINPKKREFGREIRQDDYAICTNCNGFFRRLSLSRHVKKCFAKKKTNNEKKYKRPLTESLIYTASKKKYGKILSKLSVKKVIFTKMLPDDITRTAINDILIAHFGEDLLKKNKSKRCLYHISNKLRECARFLLEMRKHGEYTDMLSTLKPESFDDAIESTKNISRYHVETKTFGAASLALHFGTTLKKVADLATKIVLRNKIPGLIHDLEKKLIELKRFRKLVDTQWTTELGSLALKNLNERAAVKPQLLPLTEDIMKLKKFVDEKSDCAYETLRTTRNLEAYRILVETTLVSTILHNRKRVGDIQFLDIDSYKKQTMNEVNVPNQIELATSLSQNEKLLTQHYKRIVSIGKGSRAVTILIPRSIQKYFSIIYKTRMDNPTWFLSQNTYFFTYPYSDRWIDGCSSLRKYARICGAKNPELLTSSRLRKHIATVTQILNLKGNEIDQLAKFMGHTTRTHEQFYKLPQDVYQVAKVSKILQLMEQGNAAQFKNRSLEEIEIDMVNIIEDKHIPENHEDLTITNASTSRCDKDETKVSEDDNNMSDIRKEIPEKLSGTISDNVQEEKNNTFDEHSSDDTDSTFMVTNSEDSEASDVCLQETKIYREKIHEIGEPSKIKARKRERWSQQQRKLMQKYFNKFIEEKKPPRKNDCEDFIKSHKSFVGVSWVRVKTFVYNMYRLQQL